jgi:hypothetical protein
MSTTLMTAHNQWASRPSDQRFQTIEALALAVSKRRNLSRATDVPIKDISAKVIENNGKQTVVLNHGIKQVEPSHWAFGQFAATVKAPAAYLRDLPPQLVADNLNHGLQKYSAEVGERKFMTLIDEEGELNTLQAVTSPTYGRIWDADVVSAVQRLNERTGGKFYNPKAYAGGKFGAEPVPSGLYASDRDVFIFMIDGGSLLDVGPRAQLNRGFIVGNSEVGSKTFWLTTFLFNQVCGNHFIFGAQNIQELSIRHTKNGPARFDAEAAPTLLSYVNSSAKDETAMVAKAIDYLLPAKTQPEIIEWVQKQGKFSKGEIIEAIAYANREEGDCRTLWDLVQGFTASARELAWIDARMDLEARSGKLLNIVSGN